MKYIIDVPEDRINDGRLRVLADMENSMTYWIETGIRVTPYEESSDTAEDAWKMICHVLKYVDDDGMSWDDIENCFGTDNLSHIGELSYAEAREMYEAWKADRDRIKVGDEVENTLGARMIVCALDSDENLFGFGVEASGKKATWSGGASPEFFHKTGRHFDAVEELLKKMRETE